MDQALLSFNSLGLTAATTIFVGAGAGLIRGFTGFGGAVFAVPILSLAFDPQIAVTIVLISGFVGTLQLLPSALPFARWSDILPIITVSSLTTPLGIYLLFTQEPEVIRRSIGFLVLLGSVIMLGGWSWRGSRNVLNSSITGALSGVINGLGGVGGAIATLYLIASPERSALVRANLIIIIGALSLIGLIFMTWGKAVTLSAIVQAAVYIPSYMITIWIGSQFFKGANDSLYRQVALCLLFCVGFCALIL